MTAEANREMVRRYFQGVSADYYADDAELHDVSQPRGLRGRQAISTFLRMYLGEAFPDGRYDLHTVLADERCAMAEWTFHGTNSGPIMGEPPTGRRVEFSGVSTYEIHDGRFVRARIYYDTGTLADQLGLTGSRVPPAERARWTDWWEGQERG